MPRYQSQVPLAERRSADRVLGGGPEQGESGADLPARALEEPDDALTSLMAAVYTLYPITARLRLQDSTETRSKAERAATVDGRSSRRRVERNISRHGAGPARRVQRERGG